MRRIFLTLAFCATCLCACSQKIVESAGWRDVVLQPQDTGVQPMTGLVLWPDEARNRNAQYGKTIQLEFSYCLPCKVVTGRADDGTILYDWSWFENLLADVAGRGHQLIARFRYEYPSGRDVDGNRGTTAVPQYIKQLPDYKETYAANPGGDGPTWYADWSNAELQRFTLQFYADFAQRYAKDPRLAFVEVGFGHWAEYHIYGSTYNLGHNFPSMEFQKRFFEHLDTVMCDIPWAVSIDASSAGHSPVTTDAQLMALQFGLFDDSFMHKNHEIGSGDGYNEQCWNKIGRGTRWQTGVCGGEISYYSDNDQRNFLNPAGMYGHTWAEQSAKYHITFMIANDAPHGGVATPDLFRAGSMATGYRFVVKQCETNGQATRLLVCNEGVAPLYRDAFFAVGGVRSETSLKGLLPGQELRIEIPAAGSDIHIESDYILPSQSIGFASLFDFSPNGRYQETGE